MSRAINNLEFNIAHGYLIAIFKIRRQTASQGLFTHHSGAAGAITQCAKAGNMVGMGMGI